MINRTDIIIEARKLIGKPWMHQGRNNLGIDCVGFIELVGFKVNAMPKNSIPHCYERFPTEGELLNGLKSELIRNDRLKIPGDIIVFWVNSRKIPQHLGIYTPHGIIHSYTGRGVVEHGLNHIWEKRIIASFSYPNTEEFFDDSVLIPLHRSLTSYVVRS